MLWQFNWRSLWYRTLITSFTGLSEKISLTDPHPTPKLPQHNGQNISSHVVFVDDYHDPSSQLSKAIWLYLRPSSAYSHSYVSSACNTTSQMPSPLFPWCSLAPFFTLCPIPWIFHDSPQLCSFPTPSLLHSLYPLLQSVLSTSSIFLTPPLHPATLPKTNPLMNLVNKNISYLCFYWWI